MIQKLYKTAKMAMAGAALAGAGYLVGANSQEIPTPQLEIQTDRSRDMYTSKRAPTTITFNHEGATYTAVLRNTDLDSETIEYVDLKGRFGENTISAAIQPEKVEAFETLQESLDATLGQMVIQ